MQHLQDIKAINHPAIVDHVAWRRTQRALGVGWATTWPEVREAQRLRYRVFGEEMGAKVPGRRHGLDADEFDAYCDHLLVREPDDGAVVGTYRVLPPRQFDAAGGLYAEAEFDLAPLAALRPALAEVGRACVDARYRSGGVIMMMWSALADYMTVNRLAAMIGCCSLPLRDGGYGAAALWRELMESHLAEPSLRVRPRLPYPVELMSGAIAPPAPPLLKGYLRLGARLLGPPAWDPDFNCADLPLLLRSADIQPRYRRRFLEAPVV
jgi:putative hemolysin